VISRATELVGIVPFDWMMHHGEFVMFFGVETIELAQAARGRLQRANFAVCFWTTEEGLFVAAKVLERIENVERIENEDVQVGPFMRLMEGSPQTRTSIGLITKSRAIKSCKNLSAIPSR
jgi:hypothetical protein